MVKTWVYVESQNEELFTVGFYAPDGEWIPQSDHPNSDDAEEKVNYLNGENDRLIVHLKSRLQGIEEFQQHVKNDSEINKNMPVNFQGGDGRKKELLYLIDLLTDKNY